jgi:hypothetical protein
MAAFVSNDILVVAAAATEDEDEDGEEVVKCRASCDSLEVKFDVVGECWTFRYLIKNKVGLGRPLGLNHEVRTARLWRYREGGKLQNDPDELD